MQVDHTAAADFHCRQRGRLHPAAHYILGDLLDAQHLSQGELGAEGGIAEIIDALGLSFEREPHYARLFHVLCLIISSNANYVLFTKRLIMPS
ncbi:hypothetical protein D9M71_452220 [compost metagenome]